MSAETLYPTVTAAQITSIPAFSVIKTADQTGIAAGVAVVTFQSEQWDVGNCFASNVHTPTLAGKYEYSFNLFTTVIPAGKTLQVFLRKNGATLFFVSGQQGYIYTQGTRTISMAAGDTVDLFILHDLDTTLTISQGPSDQGGVTFFQGTWVGP